MNHSRKLRTEQLTHSVQGNVLVDDVSVCVDEQSCTGVIGPSGAGKTSFLRLLNRLDEPTSGTVYLDGVDYHQIDVLELRRRVGMIPQKPSLLDGTVRWNVTAGPRMRNESIQEEFVDRLLERMGLLQDRDREVQQLSVGEQQRVAIGRTLMNRPEVLLLDEPTSHLDRGVEREVESLLKDLMEEFDLTMVFVTHSHEQARRLCTNLIYLQDGTVRCSGTVDDVMSKEFIQNL